MNRTDCERCGEWFEYEQKELSIPWYCESCQMYLDYLDNVEYINIPNSYITNEDEWKICLVDDLAQEIFFRKKRNRNE